MASNASKKSFSTTKKASDPAPLLSKSDSVDSASATCLVCAEAGPKYWSRAVGCGHRICWICSLRLRALYNSKSCPVCKTNADVVFISKHGDALNGSTLTNPKLSVSYENEMARADCEALLQLECPYNHGVSATGGPKACGRHFKTKHELRRHVQSAHDLFLCEICLEHKKCFARELQLYNRATLLRHQQSGDSAGGLGGERRSTTGHPQCSICVKYFYSEDELNEHCRLEHEICHICQRTGRPNRYFRDYSQLEDHFAAKHYFCAEPLCRELKFIVFENELEFKRHQLEVHLSHQKMQRSQQREFQRLNFSFEPDPAATRNSASNTTTSTTHSHAPRLTPAQRTQIGMNLVFGELPDDLAGRMQSLSLYQQRNDHFMEALRVNFHLSQGDREKLILLARQFQQGKLEASELVASIDALVGSDVALRLLPLLSELQLNDRKRNLLNAAVQDYTSRLTSFPVLESKSKSIQKPLNASTTPTATKSKVSQPPSTPAGSYRVLQIKSFSSAKDGSGARSTARDPSKNPALLLAQLAGAPMSSKSSKSCSFPSSKRDKSAVALPTFSSAALGNNARSAPSANYAKSSSSPTRLDESEFPTLGGKPVPMEDSQQPPKPSSSTSNAFFPSSERDGLDSFTIGDDASNTAEIDEKASAAATQKAAKAKKVVLRYGQKWTI